MTDPGLAKRPRPSMRAGFVLLLACAGFTLQDGIPGIQDPITGFGRLFLEKADLVAEVTVLRVYRLGMGVDVARVRADRVLYDRLPEAMGRRGEHLVLSHRGEYKEETGHLLVLMRFGSGDRLITMHRISNLERFYADKKALIEATIRIERIADPEKKISSYAEILFTHLQGESVWLKGNSVRELKRLVEEKAYAFTTGDAAFLERAEKAEEKESLKAALRALREAVTVQAVEGPPLLKAHANENRPDDNRHP